MRKTLSIMVLALGMGHGMAQTSIREALKTMPQELLPYISDDQRKEIDEFTAKQDTVTIKNSLNGTTIVCIADSSFAQIDLNETACMQVRLLPVNDSTQIICMAKTVKTPIADSSIRFYSSDWKPIDSEFNLPVNADADSMLAEFTQRPDTMTAARYEELLKYLEPVIVYADIAKENATITLNLSIPFGSKETIDDIRAITRQKTFKWNGSHFKAC